jgi:hypothetical protein
VPPPGLAFFALLALAQAGPAVSVPVRVEFDAPAGCSDADAFFTGVLARTSHVHRARPGENAVRLAVHLTRAGARVHGQLRVTVAGESETRRVEGTSCAEIVQVLSLTAALAIDPTADLLAPVPPERAAPGPAPVRSPPAASAPAASGTTETPPPAPVAPTPPSPAPETVRRPPEPPPLPPASPPVAWPPETTVVVPPRPVSRPPTGPRVGAAVVAAEILSSSMALGASVSGRFATAVRGLAPSATVMFIYLPGDFLESGDDLGLRWAALAATVCPGWGLGDRLRVEPCGRVTGGLLSVMDHSLSNPHAVDRWWGSAGALLRASTALGWGLSLDVEAGVDFPFITRRFITTTTVPNQAVGATVSVSPTLAVGLTRGL